VGFCRHSNFAQKLERQIHRVIFRPIAGLRQNTASCRLGAD
jgi:hypothetical protein